MSAAVRRDHPIDHHVAGTFIRSVETEHRDKAGRKFRASEARTITNLLRPAITFCERTRSTRCTWDNRLQTVLAVDGRGLFR
jgi:hypothetical protein